jgi:hypothetical protein
MDHLKKILIIVLSGVTSCSCQILVWLRRDMRNNWYCLIKMLVNETVISNSCIVTVSPLCLSSQVPVIHTIRSVTETAGSCVRHDSLGRDAFWHKSLGGDKTRGRKYGHLISTWLAIISHSDYAI